MPKIREALFSDYEGIIKLEKDHDFVLKDYDDWEHIWKNNPAITKNWPMGWVLEDDSQEIVGYFGNIPMNYEYNNTKILAAAGRDFVVKKEFRSYSLMLINKYFIQKAPDMFIATTANYEGGKVQSAFKAKPIPADSTDIALFWITNYEQFIKSFCRKKNIPCISILTHPLSLALQGVDKIKGRNRFSCKDNSDIKIYYNFDDRFDEFWTKFKEKNKAKLLFVRDKTNLDWHFRHAIKKNHIWIFAIEEDNKIKNYIIFLRQDGEKIGLNRVRLIDYCSLDNDQNAFLKIMLSALEKFKQEGVCLIESIGFNIETRTIFGKSNPRKRKLSSWPFYYKSNREELTNILNDPKKWNPCYIDGEASI